MKTIDVNLKNSSHTIFIGQNISNDLSGIIDTDKYDDIFLLIQKSIADLYSNHTLLNSGVKKIIIGEFEDAKNLKNIDRIIDDLLEKKCSRNSLIIGCGGGVTTDITGFIASIFMRGIHHILIPTTLLGMVDASIGGKTGVNSNKGKNLIGTFKQPNAIIIDPVFLKTLNKGHIINGFAEIIKYGLVFDKKIYKWIKENFNNLIDLQDLSGLEKIIYNSCIYKKWIIHTN